MRKLSTKKRILIALAAILAVHAAFYCVPRVYCAWPRFYEAEYNEAVAILKDVVGAEAVEKGIVTIARGRVSVPFEAVAGTHDSNPMGIASYLVLGAESFAMREQYIYREDRGILDVRRLPPVCTTLCALMKEQ